MINRKDGQPDGGTLTIRTGAVPGQRVKEHFQKANAGDYAIVSVADTGIGMDEKTQSRIFEPFFSTKEKGKGTGLGLSTLYGIVQGHGGFINFTSTLGFGTRFTLYLPSKTDGDHEGVEVASDLGEVKGGSEVVLVAEDEKMLRDVLEEALTMHGYKVLSAADGEEALSILSKEKNVDIVISDIGLPKLSGEDMLAEMRKHRPNQKAILTSGYVDPQEKERISDDVLTQFLQKPYSLNEVLKKTRDFLDEQAHV